MNDLFLSKNEKIVGGEKLESHASELVELLLNETHCMARYALSRGLTMPPNLLDRLCYTEDESRHEKENDEKADSETVTSCLFDEPSVLNKNTVKALSPIHGKLTQVVAPATPRTIALLDYEKRNRGIFYFLGPVVLVRRLSFVAIFSLISLIFIASSDRVNMENINAGFFDSSGGELLLNQAFLLCCAGLGAVFSGLFRATQFVARGVYDPVYDSSYWSSLILGLMSGMIIVELIPSELFTGVAASNSNGDLGDSDTVEQNFMKPALALVGGFTANLTYRILNRIVDSIDHFIKGDRSAASLAESRADASELSERGLRMQADQAAQLLKLQKEIDETGDTTAVREKIMDYISKSFPAEPDSIGTVGKR